MSISQSKTDWAVVFSKGLMGAVPFVGPLLAEIVGATIPNQRMDRLGRLVHALNARVEDMDRERVEARFHDPEFVDLLEDGMIQASRAVIQNRIEYIAALLKNSIQDEEVKRIQDKRLLSLLGELNDFEILLLSSYSVAKQHDPEFQRLHGPTLIPPHPHLESPDDEVDAAALYEEQRNHLLRLGLVRVRYRAPKRGEMPEFDEKTGSMKASGREMTQLGYLLLRRIDVLRPGEF